MIIDIPIIIGQLVFVTCGKKLPPNSSKKTIKNSKKGDTMNKIKLFSIMALISINALSATVLPAQIFDHELHLIPGESEASILTTSHLAVATTIANAPVLGLIILADNGELELNMENEELLEELEIIKEIIEDNGKLSDYQRAILEVGTANNQI